MNTWTSYPLSSLWFEKRKKKIIHTKRFIKRRGPLKFSITFKNNNDLHSVIKKKEEDFYETRFKWYKWRNTAGEWKVRHLSSDFSCGKEARPIFWTVKGLFLHRPIFKFWIDFCYRFVFAAYTICKWNAGGKNQSQ